MIVNQNISSRHLAFLFFPPRRGQRSRRRSSDEIDIMVSILFNQTEKFGCVHEWIGADQRRENVSQQLDPCANFRHTSASIKGKSRGGMAFVPDAAKGAENWRGVRLTAINPYGPTTLGE